MTFFQLPIGLPRVTQDGEILNSCARIGREIGSGRHGSAHEGVLNGERVCLKRYHFSWSHAFTSNPAKHEHGRLLQARANLADVADSLQSPIGWYKDPVVGTVLATRLICDHDGAPSQSLKYASSISQAFVDRLERIFAKFAEREILYNPVAANILVQRTTDNEDRPFLIDFTNYESYIHYIGKGATHLISPGSRKRDITAWLQATLAVARKKVHDGAASMEGLIFPPWP
jgi:hypothetical protein